MFIYSKGGGLSVEIADMNKGWTTACTQTNASSDVKPKTRRITRKISYARC